MDIIKINYSQFSPSALLAELQNHYHLPSDSECIFFKSGLNDIYKITADNVHIICGYPCAEFTAPSKSARK